MLSYLCRDGIRTAIFRRYEFKLGGYNDVEKNGTVVFLFLVLLKLLFLLQFNDAVTGDVAVSEVSCMYSQFAVNLVCVSNDEQCLTLAAVTKRARP